MMNFTSSSGTTLSSRDACIALTDRHTRLSPSVVRSGDRGLPSRTFARVRIRMFRTATDPNTEFRDTMKVTRSSQYC